MVRPFRLVLRAVPLRCVFSVYHVEQALQAVAVFSLKFFSGPLSLCGVDRLRWQLVRAPGDTRRM